MASKKLRVNRETLRGLSGFELGHAHGGIQNTGRQSCAATCYTACTCAASCWSKCTCMISDCNPCKTE